MTGVAARRPDGGVSNSTVGARWQDRPATALAVGGGRPAIAAGIAVVVLGGLLARGPGAAGAALGGLICAATMLSIPGLMSISRRWPPEVALVAAISLYSLLAGSAWAVYGALGDWPSSGWIAVGIAVGIVAWTAGLIGAARRMRILVWDEPGHVWPAPADPSGVDETAG